MKIIIDCLLILKLISNPVEADLSQYNKEQLQMLQQIHQTLEYVDENSQQYNIIRKQAIVILDDLAG